MGRYCVAANCTNTSSKSKGISFHKFPNPEKDTKRFKEWVQQVQRTRAQWKGPTSIHTFVCSEHFSPDCFEMQSYLMKDMNLSQNQKWFLKPDAVPTVFIRKPEEQMSQPKKPRLAYEKREKRRIVTEALSSEQFTEPLASSELSSESPTPEVKHLDIGCQAEIKPLHTNKRIQAFMKIVGLKKSTQTGSSQAHKSVQAGSGRLYKLDESMTSQDSSDENDKGSNYIPSVESENEFDEEKPQEKPIAENDDVLNQPKFIVFWTALQTLLAWIHCPSCGSNDIITSRKMAAGYGSLLRIDIFCESCGKFTNWKSQPYINDYPAGNVLLSAAILFSGSLTSKVLRVFKHMRLWGIEKSTFFRHQRELLFPSIKRVWQRHQETLIGLLSARGDGIVIGGDGRADSMGHCAKYGTYTCIELLWNCIVDVRVVSSSEVGGSYHMELEGLKRSLNHLRQWLEIKTLVTDRHRQIAKWIRENYSTILHLYDIWHVAKAVGKKLEAAAKLRDCEDIRPWIQSIVNHLYWSAVTSNPGQGELIVAKWSSVINHVINKHKHNNVLFPECLHGVLEGRESRKKWIRPGSKSALAIEDICLKKTLLSDIARLSGDKQTWNLEAFHSLLNQFAPKMYYFSPIGMECRVKLAALHYNENAGREQQCKADGEQCFVIKYPKYKKGGYIVKKVLKEGTYEYVDTIWREVELECYTQSHIRKANAAQVVLPPTLCANFVHPDKDEAIKRQASRFQHKK